MKNDSKIAAKKAVPGGVKADASFTKRSKGTVQKQDSGRKGPREEYGPRTASRNGAKVTDGAGTRFSAELPPETVAMAAPPADLPASAKEIAAAVLPVPNADQWLVGSVKPWDYARDEKLGSVTNRSADNGKSGANQKQGK